MSSHTGVSCDSCMKANFPNRRYKCLLCENYDLCGACYDMEAESQNHKKNHSMQCILTPSASELFYAGESVPRLMSVSLTCPYCGLAGFIPRTLMIHCVEKHSPTSSQSKTNQVVMCPICVTSPSHGSRSRFGLLADHIATVHDDGTVLGVDDFTSSPSVTQTRRAEDDDEEEDTDEDEDDVEPALNDIEHRGFIEEEHRRQEAARQRLAQASSLAANVRNDYAAALSAHANNSNSQRRPLSRQTAIRVPRGSMRGHLTSFPYGSMPRTSAALTASASLRCPPDALIDSSSPNSTTPNDPYASFTFSQDPMLEFVSRLVHNQQTSTTPPISGSSGQFLFGTHTPISQPPSSMGPASEFTRLQQQIENNDSLAQIKTALLHARQKRSTHSHQQQQQQSSSSSPSTILTHPSGYDYQLWQQQFPGLQTTLSNINFLAGANPHDSITGTSQAALQAHKLAQQSHRENDPRSLLGKILRNDSSVNKVENNEPHLRHQCDHLSFLQSILLSSMINPASDERADDAEGRVLNKENHS